MVLLLVAVGFGCLMIERGAWATTDETCASPPSTWRERLAAFETVWATHLTWRFLADPRAGRDVWEWMNRHQEPVRSLIASQWRATRPTEHSLRATAEVERRIDDLCRQIAGLAPAARAAALEEIGRWADWPGRAPLEARGVAALVAALTAHEQAAALHDPHPPAELVRARAALAARWREQRPGRAPASQAANQATNQVTNQTTNQATSQAASRVVRPSDGDFPALRAWFRGHCRSIEPARTPDGTPVFLMVFGRRPGLLPDHDEKPTPPRSAFPPGFLWGVSTAGYQYEGPNPGSIWATHEQAGKTAEPLRRAADGLHRFEEDIKLAAGMGLNAFRTSIEWSRIEPQPGVIDPAGVAYYRRFFTTMRQHGLTPVVTLIHFSWPQWFEDLGGWTSEAGVRAFVRYVDFVSREFGPLVDWWLTFNEPPVVFIAGYVLGISAPGQKNPLQALAVCRAWIRCHKLAYRIIHGNDPVARVSWNNYTGTYQFGNLFQIHLSVEGTAGSTPATASEAASVSRLQREIEDHWLADELAQRRSGRQRYLDYIGIDYYCRWRLPGGFTEAYSWEPYPEGLYDTLKNYHRWFRLPVLIAENGLATRDLAPRADGWTREAFLVQHIKQVQRALRDGIPVLGYIHWSITDNYEWGSYTPRFGLYSVDCRREDFTRVPTPAVEAYRRVVAAGGVTPDLEAAYPPPPPRP